VTVDLTSEVVGACVHLTAETRKGRNFLRYWGAASTMLCDVQGVREVWDNALQHGLTVYDVGTSTYMNRKAQQLQKRMGV